MRRKNVLTIMMQSFISMGVIAVIWIFGGFSLAFGPDVGGVIGDITYHFALDKVGAAPSPDYATTVPFLLFFAYQLMFAIITPALITGAFAGRLQFPRLPAVSRAVDDLRLYSGPVTGSGAADFWQDSAWWTLPAASWCM